MTAADWLFGCIASPPGCPGSPRSLTKWPGNPREILLFGINVTEANLNFVKFYCVIEEPECRHPFTNTSDDGTYKVTKSQKRTTTYWIAFDFVPQAQNL